MTMKNLTQLTLIALIPAVLAGCDQYVTDRDYGDAGQARKWTEWHAKDMAVSGLGTKKCDGYNYIIDRSVYPSGEPDFGCSMAYNRATMIAHRGDLLEGRELANADSSRSDLFTEYYRQDKTKQLLKLEKVLGQ